MQVIDAILPVARRSGYKIVGSHWCRVMGTSKKVSLFISLPACGEAWLFVQVMAGDVDQPRGEWQCYSAGKLNRRDWLLQRGDSRIANSSIHGTRLSRSL